MYIKFCQLMVKYTDFTSPLSGNSSIQLALGAEVGPKNSIELPPSLAVSLAIAFLRLVNADVVRALKLLLPLSRFILAAIHASGVHPLWVDKIEL